MGTSRVNEWLQILASLGVLAGLVFLAVEIQQSNRIAIASTEITLRESWGSSNETVYTNPVTAALLAKARHADADFSDAELEMLAYFLGRIMNIWRGVDKAYAQEMVTRDTFNTAIEHMKWTIDTYPGMRPQFEDHVNAYPSMADSELARELMQYLAEK